MAFNLFNSYDEKHQNPNLVLTSLQIGQLTNIFQNETRLDFFYELISYLSTQINPETRIIDQDKFQTIVKDKIQSVQPKDWFSQFAFHSETMKEAQEQVKLQISNVKAQSEVKTGEICPNCKKKTATRIPIQHRSADEATGDKLICPSCRYGF